MQFQNLILSENYFLKNSNISLYSFNGKEKDDEWNVTIGGTLDFGARIYDSRIGRWLGVDPFYKKYPYFSSYSSFDNNPIAVLDPGGDTTVFFTQSGEFIYKCVDDGLPTAITIIDNDNLDLFMFGLSTYKDATDPTLISETSSAGRKLGLSIDVKAWRQFYNNNTVKGSAKEKNGYFYETKVLAYEKDLVVSPGIETVCSDELKKATGIVKEETGKGVVVGEGHDHPNSGLANIVSEFGDVPSSEDQSGAQARGDKLDVIVSRTSINLYSDCSNGYLGINLIKVDKSTLVPDPTTKNYNGLKAASTGVMTGASSSVKNTNTTTTNTDVSTSVKINLAPPKQ